MDAGDAAKAAGFHAAGEALRAAGGPQRHGLVEIVEETTESAARTAEGDRAVQEGLPERRAVEAIRAAGGQLPMPALGQAIGNDARIAIGWLKRKGWATMEKTDEGTMLVLTDAHPARAEDEEALETLEGDVANLASRGLVEITTHVRRSLRLTKTGQDVLATLGDTDGEEVNQVTPDLIAKWADLDAASKSKLHLRRFDFDVAVAPRHPGKIHPLTQIIDEVRRVFQSMGFQEIAGDYVESAYWNMDALFIPQDHPARDMQDTFYLDEPATLPVDTEDLQRGKSVHETGGDTGSTGWGGDFDAEVSRKALLRTHTTNTTVKHLRDLEGDTKVFGIGRVFRKETMDATHLPEFTQIEGIVTEPGANFNMLVGLCREFFTRMGFPEVRLRPAYFPYTEPSMEVDVMWNGKWMELGGSGIFRPEVTQPLGVEHPVLAWGFGLERLAMMRLGLKDIRDLYVSDVKWLKENPLQ